MASGRTLKLAATGTAAGLFSGLFGVGGGIVIVPLLVLWVGYDERRATGTSLAAIAAIAVSPPSPGCLRQRRLRQGAPRRPSRRSRRPGRL